MHVICVVCLVHVACMPVVCEVGGCVCGMCVVGGWCYVCVVYVVCVTCAWHVFVCARVEGGVPLEGVDLKQSRKRLKG